MPFGGGLFNISYMSNHRDEIIQNITPEEMTALEDNFLTTHFGTEIVRSTSGTINFDSIVGNYYFFVIGGMYESGVTIDGADWTEKDTFYNGNNYAYDQICGLLKATSDRITINKSNGYCSVYDLNTSDSAHVPTLWRSNNSETVPNQKYFVVMGCVNNGSYNIYDAKTLQNQDLRDSLVTSSSGYNPWMYTCIATAKGTSMNYNGGGYHRLAVYKLN